MDFALAEEQQMLADVVGRFVDNEYAFEARRRLAATTQCWSSAHWSTLADMGLLALNVPEQYGGLGASPAETMIVMEALGRGLVLEPFLSTAVLGARLIGVAGHEARKASWLASLAAGSLKTALATLEPGARFDLWNVTTTAKASGAGYVLNGRKGVVLHGDSADLLFVSARTSGEPTDTAGITLFAVDAKATGVTVKGFPALDGQRVAEITLDDVHVNADAVLGTVDEGFALLEWTVDHGIFALCAEAVGAMEKLADLTYDYLRTRKQFGAPIGKFQALQHRAADILSAVEQARSMVYFAAAKLADDDTRESHRAVCAAKAMIGRSGRFVAQQAIQLHGGMGMTDELSVGWYVKRLTCIDMTWGNTEHHVELYGAYL
ncbi:acyl-CoA dehydrogenase family protein [Paraburkholderia rhynchosiae]|uniref:L-prolyl-[peptidyl-carrier protein] dehydrogenase n=1 Tax=Paraburkholderia rhynchosiae TaxID=487049 RepID=A0A2N7WEU2_9BURK|nr:acyl-CoA dehydrogenase [Paraburkholderia rhynchosiae]PMS27948.1 pimeloyl-CoA dehydrogenase small subunit [Paraburkholderia rhynchosiae]CAB3722364.1 L-prolyl-[peptidyl-carrier protein] dehydrogenase [Paraburkholderia rhynchosiae]